MGIITNLDELFPEDEIVKFKDKAGKVYEITLFIPVSVGLTVIENIDMVTNIFPATGGKPRITKDAIELVIKLLADICHEQYEEIDREWIKKNVSLPRQAFLIYKMAVPIYEFLTSSGFMEAVRE